MQIHEVMKHVGLSKKAINLYEEKGLICVNKSENGYRDYDVDAIDRLWEIKVLRKLDFSLADIEEMMKGKRDQVFQDHFDEIDRRIAQCHTQKEYIRELYEHTKPQQELYQQLDQEMEEEFTMQEKIKVDIRSKASRWTTEEIYAIVIVSIFGIISPYPQINLITTVTLLFSMYKLCMLRGPSSLIDITMWNIREKIIKRFKKEKKP